MRAYYQDRDSTEIMINSTTSMSLISRGSQSYFWVVFWELGFNRSLLLSSVDAALEPKSSSPIGNKNSLPRSLCAMRRNEQPAGRQRVVATMRNVVKNLVRHCGGGGAALEGPSGRERGLRAV